MRLVQARQQLACCRPRGRCCWRCRPAPPRRRRSRPGRSGRSRRPRPARSTVFSVANRSRRPSTCSSISLVADLAARRRSTSMAARSGQGDLGPDVDLGGELQRLAVGELGDLHLGAAERLDLVLADGGEDLLRDRLLHRLVEHRAPADPLVDDRGRHLALAEAGDARPARRSPGTPSSGSARARRTAPRWRAAPGSGSESRRCSSQAYSLGSFGRFDGPSHCTARPRRVMRPVRHADSEARSSVGEYLVAPWHRAAVLGGCHTSRARHHHNIQQSRQTGRVVRGGDRRATDRCVSPAGHRARRRRRAADGPGLRRRSRDSGSPAAAAGLGRAGRPARNWRSRARCSSRCSPWR